MTDRQHAGGGSPGSRLGELASPCGRRERGALLCVRGSTRRNKWKAIMLGRHVYRVHPSEEGWTVTKEGENNPHGGFPGREEAIAEAVRLAESDEPAKVTIDNGDGTIAEEWLFGTDPVEELGA